MEESEDVLFPNRPFQFRPGKISFDCIDGGGILFDEQR